MSHTEELLPIDIHYNKLPEWLVSRRHCDQQWQSAAFVIREKINAAIQDMPPVAEVTKLLRGTYINYFHCLRIVELLKETESASKNIFGRYSSQRMKDWQEIVKLYERDGVYLAEAAQLLTRNVNYEIPSLKRQISKCQQVQSDCTRKESEYKSSAGEAREKYNSSCRQMGIQGVKIKKELIALVDGLPKVFGKIIQSTHKLKKAITYYEEFLKFTLNKEDIGSEVCLIIKYIQKKGNTTYYEYKRGEKPNKVIEPDLSSADDDHEATTENDNKADEIDFGDSEDVIDFGDESDVQLVEENTIDWGEGGIAIEVVDPESAVLEEQGVARGSDAFTLLEHSETRNMFIDELSELDGFLALRLQELQGSETGVLSSGQFHGAASALHTDGAGVQDMLTHVQGVLDNLTSPHMQHLFLIRSSPRYVERLAESLKETLSSAEKLKALQKLMVVRRDEAREEQASIEPKLDLIRKRTKELQKQIEGAISEKYKNRPVNIMGEINTV